MRSVISSWARQCGSWCLRRIMRRHQKPPTACKVVRLSPVRERWITVVVQDVGTILVPARAPRRNRFKVIRCRNGVGVQALHGTRVATGPVYAADFGLPHVLVQKEDGVKELYQKNDDLAPLLCLQAEAEG